MLKKSIFVSLALGLLAVAPLPALAQTTGSVSKAQATSSDTFTPDEIVAAGHGFFGKASRDFARAVETVFEKMKRALEQGDRIELRGFGVFTVKPRKTGIGRNPRTGAEVSIPPGKAVRFKPGKELQTLQ